MDDPSAGTSNTQHAQAIVKAAAAWAVAGAAIAVALRRMRTLNLHQGRTPIESGSRCVSFVHASCSTVWAVRLLQQRGCLLCRPSEFVEKLEEEASPPNTPEEESLFRFSSAYWLADLLYLLGFERDPLFVAHHGVTLAIWPGCLAMRRGALVPLLATFLGEVSTPLLNAWWLAKRAGNSRLERPLSRAFSAVFLPVRSVLLPLYAWAYARSALAGRLDRRLGAATARLWALLLAAAAAGGVEWSRSLAKGLLKTSGRVDKKPGPR